MGVGDPKTCVKQFIFNKKDSNDKHIIKYFVIHGLVKIHKVKQLGGTYVPYMEIQL